MTYRGYTATVHYSDDDGIFHGRVLDLRDVISFEGASVEDLRRDFEESVDFYLEVCAERGEEAERPYSGNISLRLNSTVHRAVAVQAELAGESINTFIAEAVADRLQRSVAASHRGEAA